jgi:hypothetical protein
MLRMMALNRQLEPCYASHLAQCLSWICCLFCESGGGEEGDGGELEDWLSWKIVKKGHVPRNDNTWSTRRYRY